jgi:hypothetical protein
MTPKKKFAFFRKDNPEQQSQEKDDKNELIVNGSMLNNDKKLSTILSQTHVLNFNDKDLDFEI